MSSRRATQTSHCPAIFISSLPLASASCVLKIAAHALLRRSLRSLAHQSEAHPLSSQSLAHSWRKTAGCHSERLNFSISGSLALTSLESALTGERRVLPGFSRNCLRVSALESALTDCPPVTTFRINTCRKQGAGGSYVKQQPQDSSRLASVGKPARIARVIVTSLLRCVVTSSSPRPYDS